ncbi:MAG: hypothetical protein NXH85_00990 [Pseudomonadaceae bacterium]|nr:hypothetical protein [Pseudomonadaceae bacterium]
MAEALASIEMSANWLGSLLGLLVHIATICAILAWQLYEYRRLWPHSTLGWLALKLASPALVVGFVYLGLAVFDTEGMAGLAVFYGGIAIGLVLVPILLIGFARALSLDVTASAIAVLSMFLLLSVLWFSGHGLVNQWASLTRENSEGHAQYLALKIAARHADSADGVVSLRTKEAFSLPDQRRLIHLAFNVDPDYQLYSIDVRTPSEQSPDSMPTWSGTLGSCVEPGIFHMASVLERGEKFDVRLRWNQGDAASMVEFVGEYEFPRSEHADLPVFAGRLAGTQLTMPMPVLAGWVHVDSVDHEPFTGEALLPAQTERTLGMHPSGRCLPMVTQLPAPVSSIEVEMYSEAAYQRQRLRLPLLRTDR